ncbi:FAD binding domain-containing protein [Sanguibacter sp. 25GB23B1]|uniref:FAD binding domain-containing protein n=1 Tax=unclassified Sanguibacter TaxID=2645534 RepID=UPI0032AF9F57
MDLVIDSLRVAHGRADLALADGETFLGGGTWLYSQPEHHLASENTEVSSAAPTEDTRVRGLVDLTALDWAPLTVTGDGLSIAATCTIATLTDLARRGGDEHPGWPALRLVEQCANALLASWKVWNVATVGGNVCLSLPAGAMISLAVALDADAVTWLPGGGERRVPVADLVTGPGRNTLARGEVLRSIELPRGALESRTAFRQIALSPLGRSGAVVTGRRDADGTTTLAVTASTPAPVVLRFAAPPSAGAVREAVAGVQTWFDDVHGAPDWRAHVTAVLAEEVRAELSANAFESTPAMLQHGPTHDGGPR